MIENAAALGSLLFVVATFALLTHALASAPRSWLVLVICTVLLVFSALIGIPFLFGLVRMAITARTDFYDLPVGLGTHSVIVQPIAGGGGYQGELRPGSGRDTKLKAILEQSERLHWRIENSPGKVHFHTSRCGCPVKNQLFVGSELTAPFELKYEVTPETRAHLAEVRLGVRHSWASCKDVVVGEAIGWIALPILGWGFVTGGLGICRQWRVHCDAD